MQILNLLIKPIWLLLIDAKVQTSLGTAEYGQYFIVFNLCTLLAVFLDIGINNYNVREVSQTKSIHKNTFLNILKSKLGLTAIYLAFVLIIGSTYSISMELIFWVALNQILVTFLLFGRSNLSGLHHFKTDSIISIIDRLIVIIIFAPILLFNIDFNILDFVWVQSIAYFMAICIVYFILFKYLSPSLSKEKYSFSHVFKKSWPFALLSILMVAYTRLDVVMIKFLMEEPSFYAGIYAQSFRLLDALSIFAALFAGMLLPKFSTMIKQKENISSITSMAIKLLLLPAIVLVVFLVFRGGEILTILYDLFDSSQEFLISNQTFMILIPTFIFSALIYIYSTIITAEGNMKKLNSYAFLTLIFNVILNSIFIPKYGVVGAATATFITQGIFAILCVIYASNKYGIGLSNNLMKYLGLIILAILTNYIVSEFALGLFVEAIIYFGNVGFLYFSMSIIRISDILSLVKPKIITKQ